jgi:rSAM/selenodomain-associated transferase 1
VTTSPSYRRRLVVMVKEPRAGKVKTRLGRDIGMTTAACWFRHQARALLRDIQHPGWQTIIAVSPDHQGMNSRFWPSNCPRISQGRGDLGVRMTRVFDRLPSGPVVIIGADIPAISRRHINQAFLMLGACDAVFGPSEDGGYWAVGVKRTAPHPAGFLRGVRWSTEHALADSVKTFPAQRIAMLETLRDVDTAADLSPDLFPGRL